MNKNLIIKRNRRTWRRKKNKYFKKRKIFIFKKNLWRDLVVKNYNLAKLKGNLLKKPKKLIFNRLKKKFNNIYKRLPRSLSVVC